MAVTRRADKGVDALEAELEAMMAAEAASFNAGNPPVENQEETPPKEQAEVIDLTPEERNYKKRYGDLRRHSQKKEEELTAKIRELESRAPADAPVITEEAIKEWAKTNPQATSIIRAIAKEQAVVLGKDLETQFEEIRKTNEEISREKMLSTVRKAHNDFDSIVAADAFHEWAETQPEFVQDRIFDNDNAKDVIWAIDLYKKEKGIKSNDGAAEVVSTKSRTTPTTDKGKGRFTESMVEKMSPEEFEKNWEEIQKASRTPEFYDITGAAR